MAVVKYIEIDDSLVSEINWHCCMLLYIDAQSIESMDKAEFYGCETGVEGGEMDGGSCLLMYQSGRNTCLLSGGNSSHVTHV